MKQDLLKLQPPCVALIEAGDNEAAHARYRDYVLQLEKQYIAAA